MESGKEICSLLPSIVGSSSCQIPPPPLNIERSRWSTTREKSVPIFKAFWRDNPNTVLVLEDPRLRNLPIVMLRKDRFEQLEKMQNDLRSGQIIMQGEVETITDAAATAEIIIKRLEGTTSALTKDDVQIIAKQIKTIVRVTSRITTQWTVKPSEFGLKPPVLSPEELDEEEDEEDCRDN